MGVNTKLIFVMELVIEISHMSDYSRLERLRLGQACNAREEAVTRDNLIGVAQVTGRALLAFLFVSAGVSKIFTWQAVEGYMASKGVPGLLLPLVILVEIGGGLALMFGRFLPWAAGALAGFCILAALLFHLNFQDRNERTSFFKDLALAGALVLVSAGAIRIMPARESKG